MAAQLLWLNEIVELSLEEESLVNSENDDDIPILAVVTTYMRRDLHQKSKKICEMPKKCLGIGIR